MAKLELKLFPLERFTVSKRAVHLDDLAQRASQIVAARVFKYVDHVVVAPDLCTVVPHQIGKPIQVVVVHVAGHGDVHGLQTVSRLQRWNRVGNESKAIVNGITTLA